MSVGRLVLARQGLSRLPILIFWWECHGGCPAVEVAVLVAAALEMHRRAKTLSVDGLGLPRQGLFANYTG